MNPSDLPYPLASSNPAPLNGQPADPRWARADKCGLGTAMSASNSPASSTWFTISGGIVTELYYPDIDTPQVRDLQFLITDGATFFHDPKVDYTYTCSPIDPGALAYLITSTSANPVYVLDQEIVTEPGSPVLLIRMTIKNADPALLKNMHVYVLVAPHLEGFGAGNSGFVANGRQGPVLMAHRGDTWLAVGANHGLGSPSCGFVGVNDGWQDIIGQRRLAQYRYDSVFDGNIALTAEVNFEINANGEGEFVLAVAFAEGDDTTPNGALVALSESLCWPFSATDPAYGHLNAYITGWKSATKAGYTPPASATGDGGRLFNVSRNVLLAHEDKQFSGALVASMSTPWGEAMGDSDGGYHLVWPRDMSQSATALIAAGELDVPLRALIYLAGTQKLDGSWFQNFYITGKGHWTGIQLDEYSFPIILAYRLKLASALQGHNPLPMVLAAAGALINGGPATPEERWEENSGYSPSTLAANIAALVCAADFAAGDPATAQFLLDYADFLESHLEAWTVTTQGQLVPAIPKHYIRILPKSGPTDPENPNDVWIQIHNRVNLWSPARNVVDGGFLELVRYGIRSPQDPIIKDSVTVIDAILKDNLPKGACYRRYNLDGYGQNDDGSPFNNTGVGRPWPLLTGERAHYELAAGGSTSSYVKTLEAFAGDNCLIAEQLWNAPNLNTPTMALIFGGATGSSMPLAWAHAEYIKLVRSTADGKVFDRIDIVANRYLAAHNASPLEIWNFNRQVSAIPQGKTLRIQSAAAFQLHWTADNWATVHDTPSIAVSAIGVNYLDLAPADFGSGTIQFTFYWPQAGHWEGGNNFVVSVQ
jgi:glucoamylase